ncbi:MAG: PAS domain S-box protein [Planctomycetia bacterium]|nr:PAS domain S-box protein [Planctomycetia bacterium]
MPDRHSEDAKLLAENEALRRRVALLERQLDQQRSDRDQLAVQVRVLEDLLESYPALIWEADAHGRRTFVNQCWLAFTGRPSGQELDQGWQEGLHVEDLAAVNDTYRRAQASQNPFQQQYRLRRADGLYRHILEQGIPRRDPDGKFAGFLALAFDITEHTQWLDVLRESELRFRAIFDKAPVGIEQVAPDGRLLTINPHLANLLGYSADELLRLKVRDITDPQDADADLDLARRLLAGEIDAYTLEKRYLTRDGAPIWVQATCSAVRTPSGEALYRLSVIQDITQRRRAAEDLRRSEARFRAVFDQAAVGISLVGPDGRFLAVNQKTCDLLASERDELLGLTFMEITHPDELHEDTEQSRRLLAGEITAYALEKRYLRRDGAPVWVSLTSSAVRGGDDQPLYRVNVVQDITERKRAEEQLRQSEERFRQLAENIQEVFWITSADGYELVYLSPAYEAIWGRDSRRVYQRPLNWLDDIHPDDRERVQRSFGINAALGQYDEEYRIVRPDGGIRWIRDRGFPILDQTGQVYRIAGIAEDVTQRVQAEEDRRRLEARMQQSQKLESLGILAGGIAHDFNNLLTGVLGNVSLALGELPADAAARQPIQQIETAALRAADLTKQMLAYSGKGRFVIQPIDLSRLVEEMANLLLTVISKKAVMRFEFAPSLPSIRGDATQVRQVVMNLITNASDAIGDRSGVIALRTGLMHADEAYLADTDVKDRLQPGDYVYVEVEDTGCGMDDATLARIFDPFFTTKFVGRGLGLAAVLGIVRGHHGTIKVRTTAGRGSSFRVLFPSSELTDDPEITPPTPRESWQATGTILVIDDEETVRQVATRILQRAGFKVLQAADGQQGVEVFRRNHQEIAAVILDLTMPHMSGDEVVSELRALKPETPIVLMSGYHEQEVVNLFAGQNLAGFVQKPFRASDLLVTLSRVLIGKR